MSAWKAFYEGREGHEYREYVRERYAPFIDAIATRIGYHDAILEIGCGTGTITSILADYHNDDTQRYSASDYCPEMVSVTRERIEGLHLDVAVFQLDAINPPHSTGVNVVHSHGMLEHFDDDTIRKVISNFAEARVQVHYVPGLYGEPTFGDERLMSVDAWWRICKPDQILTFNEGLDYALIFERHKWHR